MKNTNTNKNNSLVISNEHVYKFNEIAYKNLLKKLLECPVDKREKLIYNWAIISHAEIIK